MVNAATNPAPISEFEADAIVVGVRSSGDTVEVLADPAVVPAQAKAELERLLTAVGAGTGAGDTAVIPCPAFSPASVVVSTGLPSRDDLGQEETLRRAAGAAARAARKFASVAYALPVANAAEATAVAEGALLGLYAFTGYSSSARTAKTDRVTILGASDADLTSAGVLSRAVNRCRDLVNTPPGDLRPSAFAAAVAGLGQEHGLQVDVFDERQLRADGSGGILAVGQGSSDGPCLIRISYRHPSATRHLSLVGKGITFDSGGLSLKTAGGMVTMKCDMSGAAAVACALAAIAELAPQIDVTGWLAVAENMPSGTAQRPGDVIRMFGGKTVEVLNTDAEGRLVLGDALVYASADRPDALIDIATLTGAQMVALGMQTAGVMGNRAALRDAITGAAHQAGEAAWAMPLPPELRQTIDSPIADIANAGDRNNGGMLVGGLFLQEFVPASVPWGTSTSPGPPSTPPVPTVTPPRAAPATESGRWWRWPGPWPTVRSPCNTATFRVVNAWIGQDSDWQRRSSANRSGCGGRTVRRGHLGGRQRRLRLRAAGQPARSQGRPHREGQARRDVPASRMHPDQGAAARRRDRRRRARVRPVRGDLDPGRYRHRRREQVQRQRRRPSVQGPAGAGEGP